MSIGSWYWWDEKCRWPEVTLIIDEDWSPDQLITEFKDRVRWIYENIENPERHCRWVIGYPTMNFRFRHDRDRLMFAMRWL